MRMSEDLKRKHSKNWKVVYDSVKEDLSFWNKADGLKMRKKIIDVIAYNAAAMACLEISHVIGKLKSKVL